MTHRLDRSNDDASADSEIAAAGERMLRFAEVLFPWHRAITGAGVRQTLQAISDQVAIETHRVATGTEVLDWQVPDEWDIRDAFVQDECGQKVIDYQKSNLHVVSYSTPVDRQMRWDELSEHLHTLPEHPDWIPYRTAPFQKRWGFCLSHRQYEQLAAKGNRLYQVRIDAQQRPGHLEYGELLLPGRIRDEFLVTTHICHPSMANDNLSGIVVATELARRISMDNDRPLSVRFLFLPATIGAITWLARNREHLARIRGGLVLSNLGDSGGFTYKTSRRRAALIDQVATKTLQRFDCSWKVQDFTPWGYDERQFCSPGFDLPIGRLTRTPEGEYPQYHTSADDLNLISAAALAQSLEVVSHLIRDFSQSLIMRQNSNQAASDDPCWVNTHPYGEPRLAMHGLYKGYGDEGDRQFQQAVLWLLNLSDGTHSLSDIIERSGIAPQTLKIAATRLHECGLLREKD